MTGMTVELLKQAERIRKAAYMSCFGEEHAAEKQAYNDAYYKAHREGEIAASCTWQKEHREHRKQYLLDYRAAHKEELAAKARQFVHDHADRVRAYWHTDSGRLVRKISNAKRKHQRRGLGALDMKAFYAKCADLRWHCQLCGKELTEGTVTVDHIIPVCKGGMNAIENLQPLCLHCNSTKRDRPMSTMVGSQLLFD